MATPTPTTQATPTQTYNQAYALGLQLGSARAMLSTLDSALQTISRTSDPQASAAIFDALIAPNATLLEDTLATLHTMLHTAPTT